MVAQEATQHYVSETWEWDRQLPNPDLVNQLAPPIGRKPRKPVERTPGGPLDRDRWRRSLAPRVGHGTYKLLDLLTDYSNPTGQCFPGMELLTAKTGMSERAIRRGFAELLREQIVWPTYPGFPVCKAKPYQLAGGLNGWEGDESGTRRVTKVAPDGVTKVAHRTPSSSNPNINPKRTLVDAKRVDPPGPGPEPGATDRGLNSFSEEEGATIPDTTPNPMKADIQEQAPTPNPPKAPPSQGITRQATEAFMDGNIAEIPMDHEVEWMLKHCWPWWVYPAHPYGWKHGPEAALKTCTKDTASRVKFRKDLVDKLMLAGLPKPQEVDADNEWARKVTAEIMDRRIAEDAQTREKGTHCAGCGRKRQLTPGVTHCSPCRKELVEVAAP